MVAHELIQLALRARLATLEVCSTGSASLGVSASNEFTRASGSFVDDGFKIGMEVQSSGFSEGANNATVTVIGVSALALLVDATLILEGASAGRQILVGLPQTQEWENAEIDPSIGAPYIGESYLPGPAAQLSFGGSDRLVELAPIYVVQIQVPENTGLGAANGYADSILNLFAPGTAMTLSSGETLRVRSDEAPYRSQLLHQKSGWATLTVSIPLRTYTTIS